MNRLICSVLLWFIQIKVKARVQAQAQTQAQDKSSQDHAPQATVQSTWAQDHAEVQVQAQGRR
jgi:hypothetical protein